MLHASISVFPSSLQEAGRAQEEEKEEEEEEEEEEPRI